MVHVLLGVIRSTNLVLLKRCHSENNTLMALHIKSIAIARPAIARAT